MVVLQVLGLVAATMTIVWIQFFCVAKQQQLKMMDTQKQNG